MLCKYMCSLVCAGRFKDTFASRKISDFSSFFKHSAEYESTIHNFSLFKTV